MLRQARVEFPLVALVQFAVDELGIPVRRTTLGASVGQKLMRGLVVHWLLKNPCGLVLKLVSGRSGLSALIHQPDEDWAQEEM